MYILKKFSIFGANLSKNETYWICLNLFERSSWHHNEHFRSRNVVHFTLFQQIVIEVQCIDCKHDHFCCRFGEIWNLLSLRIWFVFFIWQHYEHFRTWNVVHLTLIQQIVIEVQCIDCKNEHYRCQPVKRWNFLNMSNFVLSLTLTS